MAVKNARMDAIARLIADSVVRSQEELQSRLADMGYIATQATLSRDLRTMGVVKKHVSGDGYRYTLPSGATAQGIHHGATAQDIHPAAITSEGILGLEFSSSLVVVKTHPGFAGAVASVIDNSDSAEIAGTIAGDDTVLLILREGYTRDEALRSASRVINGIENKDKTTR